MFTQAFVLMFLYVCGTTWCNTTEEWKPQLHYCRNLKQACVFSSHGEFWLFLLQVLPTIDAVSSTEASPCPSPLMSLNSTLPDFSSFSNRLTAISPLPDLRRDSGCSDDLLTLPVPVEFADEEARRRSLVPSEEDDSCSPSFTPSDIEVQNIILKNAKPMQRFLSLPDDGVLSDVNPDVEDEARSLFSSREEKNRGNVFAAEEHGHKIFNEQLQIAVSNLQVNLSVDVSDSGLTPPSPPQDVQGRALPMDLLIVSDIQETRRSSTVSLQDMEKYMCHIDSPESVELEQEDEDTVITGLHLISPDHCADGNFQSELAVAGCVDINETLITLPSTEEGSQVVPPVPSRENCDSEEEEEEEDKQVVKGCSLAHFEEGNDIARRSFYKQIRSGVGRKKRTAADKSGLVQHSEAITEHDNSYIDVVKIQIQGSDNNLSPEATSTPSFALGSHRPSLAASDADDEELCQYHKQVRTSEQPCRACMMPDFLHVFYPLS